MAEVGTDLATDVTVAEDRPTPLRTWGICGLMLLATMLNYMDRQTLAQQATNIREELRLSNESYGWLETGFGLAFAVGGIWSLVPLPTGSACAGFTRQSCWAGRPSGS